MVSTIGTLDASVEQLLKRNLGALAGVQGSIVSAAENREVRTILVTSCHRGEGKTVAAIGMAYALSSQANAEVLLVDGNFSDPKIHDHFNVSTSPGFADLLTSDVQFEETLRRTEDSGLTILPHGGASASLYDIYRSASFEEKIGGLKKHFDYLIYDGTSIFGSSDASLIAKYFDGIVLVVECEKTRWEVVQDAKERIEGAGGKLLGVALNKRKYYIPKAFYSGA